MYSNNLFAKVRALQMKDKQYRKNQAQRQKWGRFITRFSRGNTNAQLGNLTFEQDRDTIFQITDKINVKKILKIN